MLGNQAIHVLALTVIAGVGGITNRRFIKHDGTHGAADLIGVATMDGVAGQATTFCQQGTAMVEAGALIPINTKYFVADATGKLVPGGTVAACAAIATPTAWRNAHAAGDLVEVIVCASV